MCLNALSALHIVGDVFQHVDAEHGVESLARELSGVTFLEVADTKREPRMLSHRFLDAGSTVRVGLDPDDGVRDVDQTAGDGADSRADLQHP